jgi:hypothetical protein
MKRLGIWLGIAAIVLQTAWPLLARALPPSVALVPLCTVDGVQHYVEIPTGKDLPASVHGDHCPLCCAGGTALAGQVSPLVSAEPRAAERFVHRSDASPTSSPGAEWARAPPFPRVVTSNDHELGRNDEEALLGRDADRAPYRGRFVRLGVLHDQH